MNLRQLLERGDRPFPSHPHVGRYFPSAALESARQRLARSIERGDGPGVVIGAAGTGKSLLLQVLAAAYRERFDVVLLACAQLCTRRALLQAIHFELGLEYRRRDEGQLRLTLLDQLLGGDEAVQGLLLLVDEAQALPLHLVEELRILTNLARGGVPRVRLVLAGLPSLEEKLTSPELESFSQRLAVRCYLAPLTREETANYVRAQLAASSADPERLFAADAYSALFDATDGVPRLVNQLCDRALGLADTLQREQVDASVIQAAWADLQQLPTPWNLSQESTPRGSTPSSVVEFGSLSDQSATDWPPADEPVAPLDIPPPADHSSSSSLAEASSVFAPGQDEPVEPTELDEEPVAQAAVAEPDAPPLRPLGTPPHRRERAFGVHVPEAIDPFNDHFDDEQWVLDNFAALSGMFHARTPRVENRRDPAFSQLVQQALDSFATTGFDDEQPAAEGHSPSPPVERPQRPAIRLAVVADAASPEPEVAPQVDETDLDEPDEGIVELRPRRQPANSPGPMDRPAESFAVEPVSTTSDRPELDSDLEAYEPAAEAILVIEDEPSGPGDAQPGVRREEYRQLFSRLRHGT